MAILKAVGEDVISVIPLKGANITMSFLSRIGPFLIALSPFLFGSQVLANQLPAPNDSQAKISVRISAKKARLQPGEDVVLHVEIWNEGEKDVFIFKEFNEPDNPLSTLEMNLYYGTQADIPAVRLITTDVPAFLEGIDPSLVNDLSICCIALAPRHFYGGEVVMRESLFGRLNVPGKYRIQGKYWSRGFLAEDINNPFILLGYAEELKKLPYQSWTGKVETNSIWIEVVKPVKKKQ